ncbi:MAG: methionine--tRNA ligase [Candidatus Norongarragalinales archaeon]
MKGKAKAKEKIVVTSALPYVNGVKHLGNLLGSMLPADVYARFLRLQGEDVIFVCGTDEHGTACEVAALEEKTPIRDYVNKYYEIQRGIYEKWGLRFDYFGRTSAKQNHETTQEVFKRLHAKGLIAEKTLKLPFCLTDKRFLPDRYVAGKCPHCAYPYAKGDQCEKCGKVLDPIELLNPSCVICGKNNIDFRESRHLFLDLPKVSEPLRKWIEKQKQWPSNARNFALQWIREGLRERCITRDLQWGVRVPLKGYEDKVFYVWFDAPIGYISITKQLFDEKGESARWEEYWRGPQSKIIHFLGKDNIAFHTVTWPAVLFASEYAVLPYQVKSVEFLNYEGEKFSTSRKWGIFTDEALDWFPADYWRYYLLSILPEHSDTNFFWSEFQTRVNGDLADTLGNLLQRCLVFAKNNYGSKIPVSKKLDEGDKAFKKTIADSVKKTRELLLAYKLQEALHCAVGLAREANKYFNDSAPWHAIKTDPEKAKTCVFLTANALRSIAIILEPFVPFTSRRIFSQLNVRFEGVEWDDALELGLKSGHTLGEPEILFKKIDDKEIEGKRKVIEARSKRT